MRMKRKLAVEALYSSDSFNEHQQRGERRPDGQHLPQETGQLQSPDACWRRAPERVRMFDAQGHRGLALLQEIEAQR